MRLRVLNWMLLCAVVVGSSGCTALKKTLQVLKDPSIAVGEWNDQPSQVALSLTASSAINPNPFPQVEPLPADDADAPYRVNLSSGDLGSLLGQLKATTDELQLEFQAIHGQVPEPVSVVVEGAVADRDAARHIVELGDGVARQLGQYRPEADHDVVDAAAEALPAPHATPIAVLVFQLKDDGVFLGADADALLARPEKTLRKTYVDHDEYVLRPDEFKFVPFQKVKSATRHIAVVAGYQDTDTTTWKAVRRIEPTGGRYPLLVSLDEHGVTIKGED